jgi:endonuclease-3
MMVVLSAQDSDANINKIAPALFDINMESLAVIMRKHYFRIFLKLRNFGTKANGFWKCENSSNDANIPLTMEGLDYVKEVEEINNVIMREAKNSTEGIIADLHVIRVAPELD